MSFDLHNLTAAIKAHGSVARVVIADVAGSAPREVGAAMLVWADGQSGTIGGGALELAAADAARSGRTGLTRHALGPSLGQCCGGAVTLLTEHWDAASVAALDGNVIARGPGAMPLAVRRVLDHSRAQGLRTPAQLVQDWMIEPVSQATQQIWIWGAGHVGRALVDVLSPLPDLAITWVDTAADRFPDAIPANVTKLPAVEPHLLATHAPKDAQHLILTYSHEIDFQLCHSLLARGFGFCGLIGSETKWTRFRKRLETLGHSRDEILRICCPIGQKSLGKHPQAIAIGVSAQLMSFRPKEIQTWSNPFSASQA